MSNMGGKGEDKMMSSLSHSLQRAWPSDKNVLRTLRHETMDTQAQETRVMSGLLRKASMLCKPGGGVDPAHKALMKDLVLSNDKDIQTALDVSDSAELNKYLSLLSTEKMHPERSKEVDAERRELIKTWQEKLKRFDQSKEAEMVDKQIAVEKQKLEDLEREKLRISRGLGSKRSRPGSMMRLTSFRDNHRPKVVDDASMPKAETAINGTSSPPNGTGAPTNSNPAAPVDMFSQQNLYNQLNNNSGLPDPNVNLFGAGFMPGLGGGLPGANPAAALGGVGLGGAAGLGGAGMGPNFNFMNALQMQALLAAQQQQQQQQPDAGSIFGAGAYSGLGMVNNEKIMEALELQQRQQQLQLQQQIQLQQMQQLAESGGKPSAFGAAGNTSLAAAAAAVQAEAQKQFRMVHGANAGFAGLVNTADSNAMLGPHQEKESVRVQRLMVRREKKSQRERQRRLILNTLYDELGSMLFDNNEHETKDRATILQTAIEYLNKSCGIAIPPGSVVEGEEEMSMTEQCIYPSCPSPAMQGKDCCFLHGGGGRKASGLTSEERLLRRRGKKSKREKQRRHNVNVLSERLGEMLHVSECKDKTSVLNVAIQYMRKHPRKKGDKVGPADSHKTNNRSPASLKTGIAFLRASQN